MATRGSIESKAAAKTCSSNSSTYTGSFIGGGHNEETQSPFQILDRTRKISIVFAILVAITIIALLEWACRCLPALPAQQFLSDMSKRDMPTAAGRHTPILDSRNLMTMDAFSQTSSPSTKIASSTSTGPVPTFSLTLPHNSYATVVSPTSTTNTMRTIEPCAPQFTTMALSPRYPLPRYPSPRSHQPSYYPHPAVNTTLTYTPPPPPPPPPPSYAFVTSAIISSTCHTHSPKPATITLTLINIPTTSAHGAATSVRASNHKSTPFKEQSRILSPTDAPQSGQNGSSTKGSSNKGSSNKGSSNKGSSNKGSSNKGSSNKSSSNKSSSNKDSSNNINTSNGPHSDHANGSLDHGSKPTKGSQVHHAHLGSGNSAFTGTGHPRATPSRDSGSSIPGNSEAKPQLGQIEPPATTTAADSLPNSVPDDSEVKPKIGQAEPPATTAAPDSMPQWQSTDRVSEYVITERFTTMTIVTGNPTSVPFAASTPETPLTILTYETYLVGAWVPTFVAMLFAVPWLMLDTFFRTIEPYRQLARDQGATAEDSLCLNYLKSWLFITPFRALSKRHWPVFISSTLSCASILLMALAAEAVYIHVSGPCTQDSPSGCYPFLVIFQPIVRTIQSILGVMVILALALVGTVYGQTIPVSFDPRSIGATTILSNNEFVLNKVRALDPGMSRAQMLQRLAGYRFKLGPYEDQKGSTCIGLYGFSLDQSRSLALNVDPETRSSNDNSEPNQIEGSSSTRQHLLYRITIAATMLTVIALFIMLVYYYQLSYENGYGKFMDSQTLGVRLLFVSMGVVLKLACRFLHQDYNQMLPYRRLVAGHATLESTILRTPSCSTLGAMFASIKYKQPFAAFLALVAILANLLPLSLPNVPFSRLTPWTAMQVSIFYSIGVFSLLLIASVLLFFSPRSRLLPRDPGTIATVLLFVCNSQMRDLFADLHNTNQKMRDATMKRAECSYGLGMLTCDDGQKRLGIDIDPFVEYTT